MAKDMVKDAMAAIVDDYATIRAKQMAEYLGVMGSSILEQSQSPIEAVMHAAILAQISLNHIEPERVFHDGAFFDVGVWLFPQAPIGPYRADILCTYIGSPEGVTKRVAVECDGTAFHERTEDERRREKARDRYFQSQGIPVFRFTGREILREPTRCATEVVKYLTGFATEVANAG